MYDRIRLEITDYWLDLLKWNNKNKKKLKKFRKNIKNNKKYSNKKKN